MYPMVALRTGCENFDRAAVSIRVSNHVTNSEFYLVSSKVIENKTSNMYLNEQLITYLIFK